MKQMQGREAWINEVLNSTEGLERPEANPFLYEKIKYKMQDKGARYSTGRTSIAGWAAAIVMLLALNGFSIVSKISREKHSVQTEADNVMPPEMQTQTIYTY